MPTLQIPTRCSIIYNVYVPTLLRRIINRKIFKKKFNFLKLFGRAIPSDDNLIFEHEVQDIIFFITKLRAQIFWLIVCTTRLTT